MITQEKIIAWAENKIKTTPTISKPVWNANQKCFESTIEPNTVENELRQVIILYHENDLLESKPSDLRIFAMELLQQGFKGYDNMTKDKLLSIITTEITPKYQSWSLEEIQFFT